MQKNRRAGFLRIPGTIFPYDILVCLGVTRDDIIAYMEKRFVDALTEKDKEHLVMVGKGRTLRLESNAFVLWTKRFPRTPAEYAILVHEIFHTADLMLRRAGLVLSDDSDEAWAYTTEWLTREILTAFEL